MPPTAQLARRLRNVLGCSVLETITAAIAGLSIAVVLLTVVLRITYPYELEWMEGGVLEHIARVRAGEPIYTAPMLRFVPFIYPPLYYWLSAAVMPVVGEGFLGPRLVSLAASIGTVALVFMFVRRETGRRLPGLCAAALYTATFSMTEGWFDLARVDSLLPLLVLWAAYLIRFGEGGRSAGVAGVLLACALLTKQSVLVFAAPLFLYCLGFQRRRLLALAATSVLLSGLAIGYLHWRSDGWFSYYVFSLPRQHPWEWESLRGFWLHDLCPHVPLVLAMIVALGTCRFGGWWRRGPSVFYVALAVGGFGVSWLSRLHTGGGLNTLMPALAVSAILFGLAIARFRGAVDGLRDAPEAAKTGLKSVLWLAVVGQLVWLADCPMHWVPSEADRKAGDELVARIAVLKGDVIIPTSPYLATRAGKPSTAHHMAVMDLLRATGSDEIKEAFLAEANRELADPRYEAILLYRAKGWFDQTPIPDDFQYQGPVITPPDAFRPKSGTTDYVPSHLFVRRPRSLPSQPMARKTCATAGHPPKFLGPLTFRCRFLILTGRFQGGTWQRVPGSWAVSDRLPLCRKPDKTDRLAGMPNLPTRRDLFGENQEAH